MKEQETLNKFMQKRIQFAEKGALIPQNVKTTEKTHLSLLTGQKGNESEDSDGLEFEGTQKTNLKEVLLQKRIAVSTTDKL